MIKEIVVRKEWKEVEHTEEEYYCDKCGDKMGEDFADIHSCKFSIKTGYSYGSDHQIDYEKAYFCENCGVAIKTMFDDMGVKFTKSGY